MLIWLGLDLSPYFGLSTLQPTILTSFFILLLKLLCLEQNFVCTFVWLLLWSCCVFPGVFFIFTSRRPANSVLGQCCPQIAKCTENCVEIQVFALPTLVWGKFTCRCKGNFFYLDPQLKHYFFQLLANSLYSKCDVTQLGSSVPGICLGTAKFSLSSKGWVVLGSWSSHLKQFVHMVTSVCRLFLQRCSLLNI